MIEIIGPALNQWDVGRYAKITNIEADRVHFANKGDTKAVIIKVEDSQAKIPDYLFHTGKQLCVYAVNDGITVESRVFYVQNRERPENYVYEDDQRNYIYELIQNAEVAASNAAAVAQELREARDSGEFKGDPGDPATDEQVAAAVEAYLEEHPVEVPDVDLTGFVKSVNGVTPDENGNVEIEVGSGGGGSGEVDMEEVMNHVRENLTAEDIGAIPSEGRNVTNANIVFGAISTGLLANKAVTAEKLADDVIPGIVSDVLEQAPTGKDGISATHSWNGTVLTITSASGTSSADLKGAKGDKGDTPVRGTDYWTEADKAEIKSYVDNAILGGAW